MMTHDQIVLEAFALAADEERLICKMIYENVIVSGTINIQALLGPVQSQLRELPTLMMPAEQGVSIKLGVSELKTEHNVSLEFLVQLPQAMKDLMALNLSLVEDQGLYMSRIKILHKEQVNDQTVRIVMAVANYDQTAFSKRQFILQFEEEDSECKSFIKPLMLCKGHFKFNGSDLQILEAKQIKREETQGLLLEED